jgi:hypothetical protein
MGQTNYIPGQSQPRNSYLKPLVCVLFSVSGSLHGDDSPPTWRVGSQVGSSWLYPWFTGIFLWVLETGHWNILQPGYGTEGGTAGLRSYSKQR